MSARVRDSQRGRCYAAERPLHDRGRRWSTVPEVQAYVDRIVASKRWQDRFAYIRRIEVHDGRGRSAAAGWAFGRTGHITLPRWSRKELVVLHEIAHTLKHYGAEVHNAEWAGLFKMLVQRFMGVEVSRALGDSFRKHNVDFCTPACLKRPT